MNHLRQIWNRTLGGPRLAAVKSQSGMSLILAVTILGGVSITGATAIQFVSSNELSANRSVAVSEAEEFAAGGHAIARAILFDPGTTVTDPSAIPLTTDTIDGQQITYSGSYDAGTQIWTLSGTASVNNPNSTGAAITKTVSSKVQVQAGAPVPDTNTTEAWSSIFVDYWPYAEGGPSSECAKVDDYFVISVAVYIRGDLCMDDDSSIHADSGIVQVWGNIDVDDDSSVGSAANPIPYLAVGGNTEKWAGEGFGAGCRDETPNWSHGVGDPLENFNTPCGAASSTHATVFSDSPADVTMPPMDLPYWYANAKPGPLHPCTVGALPSGEEFDDDTTINESGNTFELTTAAAYDCQYWEGGEMIGRLAWTGGTTGTLTVLGTIFFDGDIHVRDGVGVRAQYDGQATLYSSREIEVEDDVWLCGVAACDATWDPDVDMLALVADGGTSSQGIDVEDNAKFQGGAYSLTELDIANNGEFWGSAIARKIEFKHSSTIRHIPGSPIPVLEGMPQTTTTGTVLVEITPSYTVN